MSPEKANEEAWNVKFEDSYDQFENLETTHHLKAILFDLPNLDS